jgi:hypothetical protein
MFFSCRINTVLNPVEILSGTGQEMLPFYLSDSKFISCTVRTVDDYYSRLRRQ